MKANISILVVMLVFPIIIAAQTGKKQPAKEKPPTAKELEEMQKEMQKAMEDMSPEDKRALDSMGFKMPSMNSIPKMGDKEIAAAFEMENQIVPAKDVKRISSISKTPLTSASMPAFLQTVHGKVKNAFDPYVSESGDKIFQWVKNEHKTSTATGNAAVGFWMFGKPELALYLMSKACLDDPKDTDNLNNFSALLTMGGAEELALPILENLNRQFPKNSTILNNIGQAWFGLGDINQAEKYLDSAIRIYANHSQANLTKSLIEESKDHKEAAVEALKKSMHEAYSTEKENRLRRLGYEPDRRDVDWNHPMPQDPMGFDKFENPDFPKSVEENDALELKWAEFKEKCEKELELLKEKEVKLEEELITATEKRMKKIFEAAQKGTMVHPIPPFAPHAIIKLKYLVEGKDGKIEFDFKKVGENVANAIVKSAELSEKLSKELELIEKKYEPLFGEGRPNPFEAACAEENKAKTAYLREANRLLQITYRDYLSFMKRYWNDQMYYHQYTTWPEEFELAKNRVKMAWLTTIKDQVVRFQKKSNWCTQEPPKEEGPFKLGDFEKMHCKDSSEIKLGIGSIKSKCSYLSAKMDLYILKNTLGIEVIKLGWTTKQGDRDDEDFIDQFQRASVEVGIKRGVGYGVGPLKAEAKAGIAGFLEVDRHGISDMGLIASAEVKAGNNYIKPMDGTVKIEDHSMGPVKDQSVTIVGLEVKMSINGGFTKEGKGLMKGVKKW